ncbi:MAG: DtxR family transcriptional regulator [bacterium]
MTIALSASLEDYLETIFHIVTQKQAARPKDIARRMEVSNASVTGALRSLAEKNLINYAPYEVISLTSTGKKLAQKVVRRHEVLRDFFINVLAVDKSEADEVACQMEHSISESVLERFIQFAEFIEICPRGGAKWIRGFSYYCDHSDTQENCEKCISEILEDVKNRNDKKGKNTMESKKLVELEPGQKAKVVKVDVSSSAAKRIVEMGVTSGAVVEIERVAPLGDPINIKVKGYHLSLRKAEAAGIEVEVL